MNFTLHTLNGIKLWLVLLLLSGAINVCRADLHDKPSTLTGDGNIVRGISIMLPDRGSTIQNGRK